MTVRIAITGARGLVGTALASLYHGVAPVCLTHEDLDITNASSAAAAIDRIAPDVIFNCAVIGVDDCERDGEQAVRVNVLGPRYLAEAAQKRGCSIVHFSTNYVFDGSASRPYGVEDEAAPINVYGRTKLEGEIAVRNACSRAFVIRTSWVFGPDKESFLATAATKLARGETVRAITDTWASTTYVADLVERVRSIVDNGSPGLYQVVNDGVCTYETFAVEAARLVGAPDSLIERISEAEMRRDAPRPRYTPMICDPPMRPWQDALADYVRDSV